MSSLDPKTKPRPVLDEIQEPNPGLIPVDIVNALRKGGKQVILKVNETGEAFQFEVIANETGSWIKAHPIKTAMIGASAVTFFAPLVASGPILAVLGLGANGPVAGGVAAMFQSVFGQVAARGVFATMQSAAMGGYGVTAVSGFVSAASAGTGIVTGFSGGGKKVQEAVLEEDDEKKESKDNGNDEKRSENEEDEKDEAKKESEETGKNEERGVKAKL